MLRAKWVFGTWWSRISFRIFGLSRRQLRWINASVRAELVRVANEKAAQMSRADRAECDASAARNDLQAANQRAALDQRRVIVQANTINDLRDAADMRERDITHMRDRRDIEIAEANQARDEALAEVARLETLIGNARNQLDGRKHHPDAEPVFLPLYTPEILM